MIKDNKNLQECFNYAVTHAVGYGNIIKIDYLMNAESACIVAEKNGVVITINMEVEENDV